RPSRSGGCGSSGPRARADRRSRTRGSCAASARRPSETFPFHALATHVLEAGRLLHDAGPDRAAWIAVLLETFAPDAAAVAGRLGGHVAAAPDDDGIHEVLVQVIDELGHAIVHAAGNGEVVEHREVLHQFAQPDATRVGANRHAELRRHQNHRQILVHAAEPATIDLAEV